jgi:hypothetical protein
MYNCLWSGKTRFATLLSKTVSLLRNGSGWRVSSGSEYYTHREVFSNKCDVVITLELFTILEQGRKWGQMMVDAVNLLPDFILKEQDAITTFSNNDICTKEFSSPYFNSFILICVGYSPDFSTDLQRVISSELDLLPSSEKPFPPQFSSNFVGELLL